MGSHLIDSTEMYVRTVWELEEEGIPPIRARLSERLNLSAPSVSETVSRLEDDGLLHLTEDRTLELTPAGRQLAISVMRKHRLAERLLVDVIGLEWEHVHLEACRWEHVISDDVERKLVELLDHPERCPHGNPIPGIAGEDVDELTSLVDVARRGVPARVARISELLQGDVELMKTFAASGVRPDAELRAVVEGELVRVEAPDGVFTLSVETSELVRVQPIS